MSKKIVVLPGDGIGPEVTEGAVSVLKECASIYSLDLEFEEFKIGGAAIDECGQPLPEGVIESCLKADAVMLGAVGAPKHDNNPTHLRPEKALMGLRKALGVFANLRPIVTFAELLDASPVQSECFPPPAWEKKRVREGPVSMNPAHGSAPDIAGKDMANPLATIGSAALLFRYSLQREDIAGNIESAIRKVLSDGYRTRDIAAQGEEVIGCSAMSEKVLERLSR